MESWENIILQWINCLCNSNNSIKSIDELQDGKIYYNLINRAIPWSSKQTDENEEDMVFQFLRNEYPNFAFRRKNSTISNLCTASLILSRLSLEPTFHKSLCMNLDVDVQITIKSILESVYSLDKSITAEDLCEIFSLSSKKDFKSLAIKPKFILEEFLKSPAARTIQNDNKQFEQAKQIRQLKAEIETMKYEKSEAVEDMKAQSRQIRDLQNKLQEALSELKKVRADSSKRNSCNFSVEAKDRKGLETAYQQELESLEKYANDLQTDNYQLQDEKKTLSDEVKLYKEKYQLLKEKNENNQQAIESMLLQIEKKEDELMEIKMRYDELLNHVKERTKTFFNNHSLSNQSFEIDDRTFAEMSLNKSEALSSVIEIQLEEVRKDYNILEKQYKNANILLSVFMEEYEKLKRKNESLIISNREIKAKFKMQYMTDTIAKKQNSLIRNDYIIRELIIKDINCSIKNEFKLSLINLLKGDVSKKTFFLQLLNSNDIHRSRKPLKKNISFPVNKEIDSFIDAKNMIVEKYDGRDKIKYYNKEPPSIQFNVVIQQQNVSEKPTIIFKVLLQEIVSGLVAVTGENDVLQNLLFKITKNDHLSNNTDNYLDLINFVKKKFEVKRKCPNLIEYSKNGRSETMMSASDWKMVNFTWTSLSESLENDVKIHKLLLLLEQSWLFVSASLKDIIKCSSSEQFGIEQLLRKKEKIESELKNISFENSQILSFNLIAAVQFVTMLTSYCNEKTSSFDLKCLTILTKNGTEVNLSDISEINVQRKKDLATKIINVKRRIDNFNYSLNLHKEELANANHKDIVQDNVIEKLAEDNEISNDDDKKSKNICIEKIKQEVVEEDEHFSDLHKENEYNKVDPELKNEKRESVDSENKVCIKLVKNEIAEDASSSKSVMSPQQIESYVREIHEKYELKLEKMKDKMKLAFNNQVSALRRDQEQSFKSRLDALQAKLDQQCCSHSEELRKYKKHISELTTQLWDVGEKLIIEKQKKEEFVHRVKELKTRHESSVSHPVASAPRTSLRDKENCASAAQQPAEPMSKMQSVRGFQLMGNAFRSEDEEGELFDTTYIRDLQKQRPNPEVDRLSILQLRNAKCKPHLKSSYPAEMQFYPPSLTEDEIKTGSAQDETFNDSLSQSLLTGKKVKKKDRTKSGAETPRRRFSSIFRKTRLSLDHK